MFKTSFRRKGAKEQKDVVTLETGDLQAFAKENFTKEEVDEFLWYGMSVQYFQPLRSKTQGEVRTILKRFGEAVTIQENVPVQTQDELVKLLKDSAFRTMVLARAKEEGLIE